MDIQWINISPNLTKGIGVINQLEEIRFEQYLRRIVSKLKVPSNEIFTEEEIQKLQKIFNVDPENLLLSIKTLQYIFKRMIKFIFMPVNLKKDLKSIGFSSQKADALVKVWSAETRSTLNDIGSMHSDQSKDALNFSWKLNAELSSDYQKKSKTPKAYISLMRETEHNEMELTHPELYSLYLHLESVQNELDNLLP